MSMYTTTPMLDTIYQTGPSSTANGPVHPTGTQNAHTSPHSNTGAPFSLLDAAGIPTTPSAAAARLEPGSLDDFLQVFSTPTQFSEYFRQQIYLAIADVPPEVLRLVGSRAYNTLLAEYQFVLKEITGIKEVISHLLEAFGGVNQRLVGLYQNYPAFPGPMWAGHPYGQPPILQTTVRQGSAALARLYAEAKLSAPAAGSSSSSSASSSSSIPSSTSSIPSYTPPVSAPPYPPSSSPVPTSPASYLPSSSVGASAPAYLSSSYTSSPPPAASFCVPSSSMPPPSCSVPPPSSSLPPSSSSMPPPSPSVLSSSPSSPTKAPRAASSRSGATSARPRVAPPAILQSGPASRSPNATTPRPRLITSTCGTPVGYRHYATRALSGSYGDAGELDGYNEAGDVSEGHLKQR
ncbi:hypothetical protein C8R43DRAFT_948912 [Mycena crocata]|nr:hypothetical protein C8R43DRAFT_948912 [Mycena crocata]